MTKYHAKKVIVTEDGTLFEVEQLKKYNIKDVSGIKFDSKMEAEYYLYLKQWGKYNIELQPTFILQDKPKIKYIADFKVTDIDGEVTIIDVKGTQTTVFRLKKKLFKARYPDVNLRLITRKGRVWVDVS